MRVALSSHCRLPAEPLLTPHRLSVTEAAAAIAAGDLPCEDLVDDCLAGIEKREPVVRAWAALAFCGLCALKPSWGLVSREGAKLASLSCDTIGRYAREVSDLSDAQVLAAAQTIGKIFAAASRAAGC